MRQKVKILYILFLFLSCSSRQNNLFLSPDFVNLKGKESLTIIKNSTSDTLRLTGTFFNYLPYVENPFTIKIAPNQKDTLKFNFTYPDFIYFEEPHSFTIFNAPGKIVECEISSLTSKSAQIIFRGELSDVNEFYLTYHNQMGSGLESSRPYFEMGNRIKDFNKFPAIADSINQLSIEFIKNYNKQLPNWFKKHEEWRQKYLSASLKDNVLMSKEFYGGEKIKVSDNYYGFQNEIPVENEEMIMNTQYLYYIRSYNDRLTHLKIQKQSDVLFEFSVIDSLFKNGVVGDILRMDKLSWIHNLGYKPAYDSLITKITFVDNKKKEILDSLINVKYGLPRIGKIVPKLSLKDLNGKEISLDDFKGKHVIINFWAVWCGPCKNEFPHENKLYNENKDKGLTVINICVDSEMNQWKAVSKKKDLQMINLYTDKEGYKRICKVFGIFGLPKSILLGKNLSVVNNNLKRASLLTEQEISSIIK